ncbi:MAG: OsmC family protein, partial [Ferruginibacter sp.]
NGHVYKTTMLAGKHELIADEPKEAGGNEEGPAPGDYLCMALASCKAITIRMYAQRKNWELGEIKVKVNLVKGDQLSPGVHTFFCDIKLDSALDDEQLKRILEISKACPIDRLLKKESEVVTVIE